MERDVARALDEARDMVIDAYQKDERGERDVRRAKSAITRFSGWWSDPVRDRLPGAQDVLDYLNETYGTELRSLADAVEERSVREERRVLFLMLQAVELGTVDLGARVNAAPACPPRFEATLESYIGECASIGNAEATLEDKRWVSISFLRYVDPLCEDLAALLPMHVTGYFLGLGGLRRKSVAQHTHVVRDLLRYLESMGWCAAGLSERVPRPRVVRNETVPYVWSSDDVRSLIGAIDRSSAVGKRDYAMLLLVAHLGLRSADLRNLELTCLDWVRKEIRIDQHKTGVPLRLPLLDDVGWAIIDYLRDGRPETACGKVFVCHTHPFGGLGASSTLSNRLYKYARKAGIGFPDNQLHGLHSLRGSLATNMIAAGAPMPAVTQTLGQQDSNTTAKYYVRLELDGLRQCAMDVEDVTEGVAP